MAGDILPVFQGRGPDATAEALSEPFLRPDEFAVGLEDRVPDLDPENLVGLGTLYLGPPIPLLGTPGEIAVIVDPYQQFSWPEAATAFAMGYHRELTVFQLAIAQVVRQGMISKESLASFSSGAIDIVRRSSFRTIATLAVTGTPEQSEAHLLVPKKVSSGLGVAIRDKMIAGNFSEAEEAAMAMMSEGGRHRIMTQDPSIRVFGVIAAANLLPPAATIPDIIRPTPGDRASEN
jgi:hypothetical protein